MENDKTAPPAPRKREERPERPKNSLKEDLGYRIKGLEQAKEEPGMNPADIAALERVIVKLRLKQEEKAKPAEQTE